VQRTTDEQIPAATETGPTRSRLGGAWRWAAGLIGGMMAAVGPAEADAKPRGRREERREDREERREDREDRENQDVRAGADKDRAGRDGGGNDRNSRDDRGGDDKDRGDRGDGNGDGGRDRVENAQPVGDDGGSLRDRLRGAAERREDDLRQAAGDRAEAAGQDATTEDDDAATDGGDDGISVDVDPASGALSVATGNITFSRQADGSFEGSTSNIDFSSGPPADEEEPDAGDGAADGGDNDVEFES